MTESQSEPHGDIQVDWPVWRRFLFDHADGGVLTGEVVRVVPFGAFVSLEHGVHGLLHMSEYGNSPAPEVGARISVRIMQIDPARQRMSLGMA